MSGLGRRFVKNVDAAIRTVETSLTYMEAAMRGCVDNISLVNDNKMSQVVMLLIMNRLSCDKIFVAHFEHYRKRPNDFAKPLGSFLELSDKARKVEI